MEGLCKLRSVVLTSWVCYCTGPPALVAQWDVKKTARQNYEALGLMHKRPLSLKKSGGVEAAPAVDADEAMTEPEGAGYTSSEESESDGDEPAAEATPRPDSTATSKDIPRGFARIERDASGKILRVVMSAYDADEQDNEETAPASNATSLAKSAKAKGKARQLDAEGATPWGAPLNDEEHERLFEAEPEAVEASNQVLRGRSEHPPCGRQTGADRLSRQILRWLPRARRQKRRRASLQMARRMSLLGLYRSTETICKR